MTTASRSLAAAPLTAHFASGVALLSYTTTEDRTARHDITGLTPHLFLHKLD
jgi:hypothetical protein